MTLRPAQGHPEQGRGVTSLRVLISRLLALFTGRAGDAALRRDIETHIDLLAAEHVRRGLPPHAAREAARRDFGGVEQMKDAYRDQGGLQWIADLWRDVQYAVRSLRHQRGFTAVAILTLALGIGANTAMFSLLEAILLRPLPVRDPEQLVTIKIADQPDRPLPQPVWKEIEERRLFEDVFAWTWTRLDTASGGEKQFVDGIATTPGMFQALGVRPFVGRLLTAADEGPNGGR